MGTITLNIDGHEVKTEKGKTVLEAALDAGIYIPHLCYHPDLSPLGACRLCLVEIEGVEELPTACTTLAAEGMVVKTSTPQVEHIRRIAMELILAAHPLDCLVCFKSLNCELKAVAEYLGFYFGITEQRFRIRRKKIPVDTSNPLFDHDLSKCILCGRCIRACSELRGVGVLSFIRKGRETYIGTAFDRSLADADCRFCGACIEVCPVDALRDKEEVLEAENGREAALVPCKYACPAGIDIPRYIRFIREKKYSEAAAVIREKVPFPKVLGRVCDHPCETACRRCEINEPISIMALKRFAAERDPGLWKKNSKKAPPTGKRVAIVGSGPAGLPAAYYLAKLGHEVTVFEALSKPGGMLRSGIPRFQLPEEIIDREINDILSLGIELRLNSPIQKLEALFEGGYDAIFIAVGLQQGRKLPIPGAELDGVLIGLSFLHDVNMGNKVKLGNRVLVLGGGGVACDVARVARRLGVAEVHMACLESRQTLPAHPWEIDEAEEEGIIIHPSHTFTNILGNNGHVSGVECLNVKWMEFDEEGKLHLEAVEGSEHVLEADTVIFAIGQALDADFIADVPGINLSKRGIIIADPETMETGRPGVFAGGDAVTGPASVIEATAAGRKGAIAIDKYLGGSGIIDEELSPVEEPNAWLGREENFAYQQRYKTPCLPLEQRLSSFSEIEHSYDEGTAIKEALRCLQCDLRLNISPVMFPPKRPKKAR